jgi:hypothetical protein
VGTFSFVPIDIRISSLSTALVRILPDLSL